MSQHDYVIDNASGATVRADINSALAAIQSLNSGTSAPSTTAAGMLWLDTTGGVPYALKVRDAGNNHWLTLADINDPGADQILELPQVGAFTGMIGAFANNSIPSGWLACDGSAVSRSTYASLFGVIGTTWGTGDGSSTFNLPDLEGAFLRGTGSHGSSTMADGNAFAGPSVGSFENDQFQGHRHEFKAVNTFGPESGSINVDKTNVANGSDVITGRVFDPITDGTNGTPRTGDETRPFNAGVKYCIKF